jgi:hypothetical protein
MCGIDCWICDGVQAIYAEGKEHALALGVTLMSTKEM